MLGYVPVPADVEKLARVCVDCGMHVPRELGPGFKEVIYERAFCLELNARGVPFETEKRILVRYKAWTIAGQKVDLLVGGVVLVEIKAVPRLRQIHTHQILSYLKTLDLRARPPYELQAASAQGRLEESREMTANLDYFVNPLVPFVAPWRPS